MEAILEDIGPILWYKNHYLTLSKSQFISDTPL